jgi:hypothetical protein
MTKNSIAEQAVDRFIGRVPFGSKVVVAISN